MNKNQQKSFEAIAQKSVSAKVNELHKPVLKSPNNKELNQVFSFNKTTGKIEAV